MAIQITTDDPSKYPVISFKPTRDAFNRCSFQDKLNFANTGVSADYKLLFAPVPKISSEEGSSDNVQRYKAYDPERDTYGNVYNPQEPKPDPEWFTHLSPYNPITKTYKIDAGLTKESNRIEKKYYPNGVPSSHPAFDPHFNQYGGARNENIIPVIDIDPTIPPFMNMYFHMKGISDYLKAKSQGFAPPQIPSGVKTFAETVKKTEIPSEKILTI